MNNNKTIEIFQVIFGLIMAVGTLAVLAYLEITLHKEPTNAHISGIIAGAIGRFYLFVQGTTIGGKLKFFGWEPKIKDFILAISITISAAFIWYIYGVWIEAKFETEVWYLFLILISILTVIEWIFGLRTARLIDGFVENIKKALQDKIDEKNRMLTELREKISRIQQKISKLQSDVELVYSQKADLEISIHEMRPIYETGKELIKYPFIVGDKKFVKCPCCYKNTQLSPNTKIVICAHPMSDGRICNTKVWSKE